MAGFIAAAPAHADPAKDLQIAARALTFLENGPSGKTVIGVVYDPSKPASVAQKDAVMAALGFVYGPFWGGLLGAAGSFCGGALAYGLCRGLGRRIAVQLVGEQDLARGERLFANAGGWLVAWSRWLPLLPEVIACLAGLARMPARPFFLALACGCLPLGFIFAAVGHAGVDHPTLALTLSALLPPVLWLAARAYIRFRQRP